MSSINVFTDGASRGNPGFSGIGVIIYDKNDFILRTHCEFADIITNNQAEYKALLKSLKLIKELSIQQEFDNINFYLDSELVVKQIKYEYRIKEADLALLNNKFHFEIKQLGKPYTINYVGREKNKAADRLANQAIDKHINLQKISMAASGRSA